MKLSGSVVCVPELLLGSSFKNVDGYAEYVPFMFLCKAGDENSPLKKAASTVVFQRADKHDYSMEFIMYNAKRNICFNFIIVCIAAVVSVGSALFAAAEIVHTPEGVIITHYPAQFDLYGPLEDIDARGIVVHDRYFPFAPHTKFMTPQNASASSGNFKVGNEVGLVLNNQRQVKTLCIIYQGK